MTPNFIEILVIIWQRRDAPLSRSIEINYLARDYYAAQEFSALHRKIQILWDLEAQIVKDLGWMTYGDKLVFLGQGKSASARKWRAREIRKTSRQCKAFHLDRRHTWEDNSAVLDCREIPSPDRQPGRALSLPDTQMRWTNPGSASGRR